MQPPTVQTLNPTHEAFQLVPVFENAKKYKITAIESWGESFFPLRGSSFQLPSTTSSLPPSHVRPPSGPRRVIVGGSDGCVRIFETNAQKQVSPDIPARIGEDKPEAVFSSIVHSSPAVLFQAQTQQRKL